MHTQAKKKEENLNAQFEISTMKLMYLYPDGLKKVQTCSLVVLQNGRRAKNSLAKTTTDPVPSQQQQKTITSFSQNEGVVM